MNDSEIKKFIELFEKKYEQENPQPKKRGCKPKDVDEQEDKDKYEQINKDIKALSIAGVMALASDSIVDKVTVGILMKIYAKLFADEIKEIEKDAKED